MSRGKILLWMLLVGCGYEGPDPNLLDCGDFGLECDVRTEYCLVVRTRRELPGDDVVAQGSCHEYTTSCDDCSCLSFQTPANDACDPGTLAPTCTTFEQTDGHDAIRVSCYEPRS